MKAIFCFLFSLTVFCSNISAQITGQFAISAVNSAGLIKIELTPLNSNVVPAGNVYYNDISFTIRWPSSYGVDLDLTSLSSTFGIVSSSPKYTTGSGPSAVDFRSFNRGPNAPFVSIAGGWPANVPITLMTIENNYAAAPNTVGDFCIFPFGTPIIQPANFPLLNVDARPNVFIADNDNFVYEDYAPAVINCALNVPLPIDLINFEASAGKDAIDLRWQTAKEENFKGFDLERSLDGIRFEKISFIPSRNISRGSVYPFVDRDVTKGQYYYYRLKMLDRDGKAEYSGIRSAILPTSNVNVSIYPNPTNGNVNLDFVLEESANTLVDVYDMTGKSILRKEVEARKDRNVISLDLLDQPAGIYSVKIIINGRVINKLVKLSRQ